MAYHGLVYVLYSVLANIYIGDSIYIAPGFTLAGRLEARSGGTFLQILVGSISFCGKSTSPAAHSVVPVMPGSFGLKAKFSTFTWRSRASGSLSSRQRVDDIDFQEQV